jgi:hypothetical protein
MKLHVKLNNNSVQVLGNDRRSQMQESTAKGIRYETYSENSSSCIVL